MESNLQNHIYKCSGSKLFTKLTNAVGYVRVSKPEAFQEIDARN